MSDLTISAQSLALNAFESASASSTAAPSGVNDPFLNLTTSSQSSSSTGSAASSHISKGAQLYSKLEQLQQTDPAEFQQVLSSIASQLQSAASGATGSDATFLNNLAGKFQAVANGTASLSTLQPPSRSAGQSGQSATQYAAQADANGANVAAGGSGPDSYVRQTLDSIFSRVLGSTSGGSASASASATNSSFTDPLLQPSANSSNSSSSLASILNGASVGGATPSPFVPLNASASNSETESLIASQFALASQVNGVAA